MAYHRRGRRGKRLTKRIMFKRPSARNQKKQIYTLAKTVARHSRAMRRAVVISRYHLHYNTTVSANYKVVNLTAPTAWSSVFDNASQPQQAKKHPWFKVMMIFWEVYL